MESEKIQVLSEYSIRYKNILSFILSERLLTITVLGSIFTFQFISSIKVSFFDPLMDFVLPEDNFNFIVSRNYIFKNKFIIK